MVYQPIINNKNRALGGYWEKVSCLSLRVCAYEYKSWKTSLRRIVDKPTRKELHAEIAKLNKRINDHVCPAWVGVDLSISESDMYKSLKTKASNQKR
jgi:hypothetical protein